MDDNTNYIDTNFMEISNKKTNDKIINGKPEYYSMGEVASLINESDSTIRFWCIKFKDILHIKRSGTHRKFTKQNIEQLKTIRYLLREKHYSINQVIEFASKPTTDKLTKDIKKDNPIILQMFSSIITNEIEKQLSLYKDNSLIELKNMFTDNIIPELQNKIIENITSNLEKQNELNIQNREELKKYIKDTFANHTDEVKTILDNKELEATKKDNEIINLLKENMKKRQEEYEKEKDKSFFSRIFRKK